MAEQSGRVRYDTPGPGVARITLARGDEGNVQDVEMLYALDAAYSRAGDDDDVGVVILAADGPDFSVGHDFHSLLTTEHMEKVTQEAGFGRPGPEGDMAWETEAFFELHLRWRNFPKPVIAQVQGRVVAGGLMILWPCDLIVAAEDATFADPVTSFGINGVELFFHPWELGSRRAKEFLFTGDAIDAEEAKEAGMVNRVVSLEALGSETLALATRIAERPSFGLRLAKKSVNQTLDIQGQTNALQAAFHVHTLAHAHCRVAYGGEYLNPAGWELNPEWNIKDP